MSYTIKELNEAIEDEETPWEGNWFEFEDQMESTDQWIQVPEGTTGAETWDDGKTFEKEVPRAIPGVRIPGIGRATFVEQYGGEGKGEDLWMVFKITSLDGTQRYFRRSGYWASFVGGDYDGPTREVKATQKLMTVYEEIK